MYNIKYNYLDFGIQRKSCEICLSVVCYRLLTKSTIIKGIVVYDDTKGTGIRHLDYMYTHELTTTMLLCSLYDRQS